MELILFLFIGFAGGVAMAFGLVGMTFAKGAGKLADQPSPVATPPENEPLSVKLHRLSQALETFGDSTAHPRELQDRTEFAEAVKLFAQKEVALDVVVTYAQGANWTLACAAIEALSQREDGEK